jgi:hypothetical protein
MRGDGGADSVGVGYRVGSGCGLAGKPPAESEVVSEKPGKRCVNDGGEFGRWGGLNGFSGFLALKVDSIYHFATTCES